ncbi:MAG: hypothetical protein EPN50_05035 [Chloroflexota bacterium]|nr:MAG: hypothetical protein EPN50_05035 [Chloroflexota bacterium]
MVGRGAGLRQLDIALLQLLQARVQAIDPNTVDAELTAGLFDVGVALGREACGLPLEGESWA